MSAELKSISHLLSLVLRHQPEAIGLTLDANGWADVGELLAKLAAHRGAVSRGLLDRVVAENDKKRFAFSDDGLRIRASQGHSVAVDLELPGAVPPAVLYHGTASRFLPSIRATGLEARSRRHVHLAAEFATAVAVGRRHGVPVVLTVRSELMAAAGHAFYLAANGVWLTDAVPVAFLEFPAG